MKQYILDLYNERQVLKRVLHQNSTPETMERFQHVTNVLKDTLGGL